MKITKSNVKIEMTGEEFKMVVSLLYSTAFKSFKGYEYLSTPKVSMREDSRYKAMDNEYLTLKTSLKSLKMFDEDRYMTIMDRISKSDEDGLFEGLFLELKYEKKDYEV